MGHVEEDDVDALAGEDGCGVAACGAAADDEDLGALGWQLCRVSREKSGMDVRWECQVRLGCQATCVRSWESQALERWWW